MVLILALAGVKGLGFRSQYNQVNYVNLASSLISSDLSLTVNWRRVEVWDVNVCCDQKTMPVKETTWREFKDALLMGFLISEDVS